MQSNYARSIWFPLSHSFRYSSFRQSYLLHQSNYRFKELLFNFAMGVIMILDLFLSCTLKSRYDRCYDTNRIFQLHVVILE